MLDLTGIRVVMYRIGSTGSLRVVVCRDGNEQWEVYRALRAFQNIKDLTFDVLLETSDDIL